MPPSYVAPVVAHVIVLAASMLLFRAKKRLPLLLMVLGSGLVSIVELASLGAELGYLGESSLYYMGIGRPFGTYAVGAVLFSIGLLWFAVSLTRNYDHRAAAV